MSASSKRHANLPDNDAVYPMHDWEDSNDDDSESDNDAPSPALDFYDVYQKHRHDHYVALLEPILRGEASTTDADTVENLNSDTVDSNGDSDDEDDLSSESDASCEEDKAELGKRSRTDHSSMTSEGPSTSHTAPPPTEATRRAIVLSTVPVAKRTRAHLHKFYSSLQLGPKQLQLLGESKHKNMSKQQRKEYLYADTWIKAGSIEPYKVICAGCDKPITLEKPRTDAQTGNEYYAGNWNKHRNQCGAVYTTWCEGNGLEPDEGKGRPKGGGKRKGKEAEKKGAREVKALPTRATGRRASLASIPVNVVE